MKKILFSTLMVFCIHGWGDDESSRRSETVEGSGFFDRLYNYFVSDWFSRGEDFLFSMHVQDLIDEDARHDLQDYIEEELTRNAAFYQVGSELDKNLLPDANVSREDFRAEAVYYRKSYSSFAKDLSGDSTRLLNILGDTPAIEEVDQSTIPHLKKIGAMVSGGTWQPYSLPVAKNHAAFAKARDIRYDFVLYSQNAESSDSKELMEWMKDTKPYWGKVYLLKKWLEENRVDKNKWVVWIDDDIVINDFGDGDSHLDRIIDFYDDRTCILTSRDYWYYDMSGFFEDNALPNTGIVMVRNADGCLDVVNYWLDFSEDPVLGKMSQEHTLHEQEALAETKFYRDRFGKKIRFVKNRTGDWNFNTFKRFNHTRREGEQRFGIDTDNDRAIAALADDAYVHHSGMISLYRLALIAHSLQEIRNKYPLKKRGSQGGSLQDSYREEL